QRGNIFLCHLGQRSSGYERMLPPNLLSATSHQELIKSLKGIFPCISLVMHEALKDGDCNGLAICSDILEGSGQRRTMGEVHRCQDPADLRIGIYSILNTPIDFQETTIAIGDRRVALLPFQNRGLQLGFALYQVPICLRWGCDQGAGLAFESVSSTDRRQQRSRKVWAPERIVQHSG